ncbi:MAG: putative motility protein [Armatimonadia bacterium]|jgi:hypothetical protein|nr:putative motility protein [Armatimonadia bacterium]
MEGMISSIAALSMAQAQQRVQAEATTSTLKKSMDLAKGQAAALLESLPQVNHTPSHAMRVPHLGRNIDITA